MPKLQRKETKALPGQSQGLLVEGIDKGFGGWRLRRSRPREGVRNHPKTKMVEIWLVIGSSDIFQVAGGPGLLGSFSCMELTAPCLCECLGAIAFSNLSSSKSCLVGRAVAIGVDC